MLIGYARVSTEDQSTAAQVTRLRAEGCLRIFEENASGGDRSRRALEEALTAVGPGDTLVVVRLDRLARSLSHLLEVITRLERQGGHFRSLSDPVDTATPQGKFALQVLGAAAELERSLIRERTRAGVREARRQGRLPGNPGLRRGDPSALRVLKAARHAAFLDRLAENAPQWVPEVRRLRPLLPWDRVAEIINRGLPAGSAPWTRERLVRAARAYVAEGFLPDRVLESAPKGLRNDDRLMSAVAAMASGPKPMTVRDICRTLEQARMPTPRGGFRWSPSSVQMLLDRARRLGILETE